MKQLYYKNVINSGRFKKGQKPPFVSADARKRAATKLKGHIVTQETRNKIIKKLTGRKNGPQPESFRIKMRVKMKGNKNSLGCKRSAEFKEEKRKRMIGNQLWKLTSGANGRFFNTLPERLVEAELIKRNISFEKQTFICGHSVDFYIPERRIVIEVDGNYWHNRPGSQECDERRNNILGFNGFNVYRFWESDIKKSVEECINKLPKD